MATTHIKHETKPTPTAATDIPHETKPALTAATHIPHETKPTLTATEFKERALAYRARAKAIFREEVEGALRNPDISEARKSAANLSEWQLGIDTAKSRVGCCKYRFKQITLSREVVDRGGAVELIRDTIKHELAHALTKGHHHDATWKSVCVALGGDGERVCQDSAAKELVSCSVEIWCPKRAGPEDKTHFYRKGHKRPRPGSMCPACHTPVLFRRGQF